MLDGVDDFANVTGESYDRLFDVVKKFDDETINALLNTDKLSEQVKQDMATSFGLVAKNGTEAAASAAASGAAAGAASGGFAKFKIAVTNAATGLATFVATNPAAWAAIAATVAISAIMISNKIADSMDSASEAAEKSIAEYEQVSSELKSMQSEYDATKQKIDQLKAAGPLSLTDQAELDKLERQNELLEYQIQIQERLAQSKQREAASNAAAALNSRDYDKPSNGEATIVSGDTAAIVNSTVNAAERTNIIDYTLEKQKELDGILEKRESLLKRMAALSREGGIEKGGSNYKEYAAIEKELGLIANREESLSGIIAEKTSEINTLYEALHDENGRIVKGNEELAESCEKLFDTVLSGADEASKKERDIATLLSKAKFDGVKDTLISAADDGGAAVGSAILKVDGLKKAMDDAGISAKDLVAYIMNLASPDFGDIVEQTNQLKEAFGPRKWETLQAFDEFLSGLSDDQLHKFYQYIKDNKIDISKWTMDDVVFNFEKFINGADEAKESLSELQKGYTTFATSVKDVQSVLAAQTAGKTLSIDDYDKLSDYAEALEYVNGSYQLNQEKVTELIKAKAEEQTALNDTNKALAQSEYLQNAAEIERLTRAVEEGIDVDGQSEDVIRQKIDALREENSSLRDNINSYNIMNASLEEATSAYQHWVNAQSATQSGQMFDGALKAATQIKDVLNNKESDEYLKIGNENYKAAVDFIIPDSIDKDDTGAVNKYLKSLSWFLEKDDKGNYSKLNLSGFIDKAVKAGLMELDETGESYRIAGTKTMQDFADGLELSLPAVQAAFGELDEYMAEPFEFNVEYDNFGDAIYACENSIQSLEREIEDLTRKRSEGISIDTSELDDANDKLTQLKEKRDELVAKSTDNILKYSNTSARLNQAREKLSSANLAYEAQSDKAGKADAKARVKEARAEVKKLEKDLSKLQEPTQVEITASTQKLDTDISDLQDKLKKLEDKEWCASVGLDDDEAKTKAQDIKQQIDELTSKRSTVVAMADTQNADTELNKLDKKEIADKNFKVKATDEASRVIRSVKSLLDSLKDKEVKVKVTKQTSSASSSSNPRSGRNSSTGGGISAMGNAHGVALAGGNYGGKTLVGELGEEAVCDIVTGKWYTVGSNGAELVRLPPNAIVFNHEQTEELLSRGYISSRGTLMMQGEAYGGGTVSKGKLQVSTVKKIASSKSTSKKSSSTSSSKKSSSSGKHKSGDSKKKKKKAKDSLDDFQKWIAKFFDWIEVRLDRLSAKTETFITKAERKAANDNYYGAAIQYQKALNNTQKQLEANQAGSKKYQEQADKVLKKAVSKKLIDADKAEDIKKKVANGKIDIKEYDEKTREVIENYKTWADKALDCSKNMETLLDQYTEYAEALYNLPLDKLNNKLEQVNRTKDLLEAQYDIADGSKARNKNIKKQNKQAKSELSAYQQYADKSASNLKKAGHAIDALDDKALKDVPKDLKKSIIASVKAGKEIKYTASEFNSLTPAAQKAVIKYNAALKANKVAATDAKKASAEYTKTLRDNAKQMFDNVAEDFAGALNRIGNAKSQIDAYVDQATARGYKTSSNFYTSLKSWEEQNLGNLTGKKSALEAELQSSVDSGVIKEGTAAWYDMKSAIDDVDLSIIKSKTDIIELDNRIRQLSWDKFDDGQTGINKLIDEANFLVDLLSMDDLFDENGAMTNAGEATQAMYAQKYNAYMRQADDYAAEIKRLDGEIANDPYNVDLLTRRQELLEAQRDSIKAANDEKKAMQDLAKDGIGKVLDKLKELINDYTDALDSAKDLRDYQQNISDQADSISKIRKQIDAYRGDSSEETKKTIQKLKNDLVKAERDLEDTQYDRYLSDTKDLLDKVYDDYEKTLNERADDIDAVVRDAIKAANANAASIKTTINTECTSVGTTLSKAMNDVWGADGIGGVLTTYSSEFSTSMTSLNGAVDSIKKTVELIYGANDTTADEQTGDVGNTITAPTPTSTATVSTTTPKSSANATTAATNAAKSKPAGTQIGENIIRSGDGSYYINTSDKGWQQFNSKYLTDEILYARPYWFEKLKNIRYGKKSEVWDEIRSMRDYLASLTKASGKKITSGITGTHANVITKLTKHSSGVKGLGKDELAWTQEYGQEAILKPSMGALLTPLTRGDSVLSAKSTANLWKVANDPTQFLSEKLKTDAINRMTFPTAGEQVIQNENNVEINLPNVTSYEEFMNAARSDPKFEKLVQAMTTDRIAGRGAKAKNSIIW